MSAMGLVPMLCGCQMFPKKMHACVCLILMEVAACRELRCCVDQRATQSEKYVHTPSQKERLPCTSFTLGHHSKVTKQGPIHQICTLASAVLMIFST